MSLLGAGAAAGGLGIGTVATAAVGGAIAAVVLSAGGTQVYNSVSEPDQAVSNISNVGYADQ